MTTSTTDSESTNAKLNDGTAIKSNGRTAGTDRNSESSYFLITFSYENRESDRTEKKRIS